MIKFDIHHAAQLIATALIVTAITQLVYVILGGAEIRIKPILSG